MWHDLLAHRSKHKEIQSVAVMYTTTSQHILLHVRKLATVDKLLFALVDYV